MAKNVKRKVTQSVADAMQELEKWMGADKERSEKVLIVAELLAYGYEVVPTPEENLKVFYEGLDQDTYDRGMKAGISHTLYTLGIKIEGVNE